MLNGKVPQTTIDRVESPVNFSMTTLTKTGAVATDQGGVWNFIIPSVFSLLLCLSMIFSSTYMLRGLSNEKENRLIEILLSSVSSKQLLTGKILGLGTAGLMQVAVWVVSLPILLKLASSTIGGYIDLIKLPANFIFLCLIFFILGYLLFAVLSAGVGAISPTIQEAQQLSSIYTLFSVVPLWTLSLQVTFPTSPIWAVLTIFPLTSPVMVIARLGESNIPVWEIAVSIMVLALSIVGGLLLTAKVFNVYLLMYGKRPKLKEIIQCIKNA
jgi:ABC-2 type transport system permease protein